jgi:beta-mannosidase
VGPGRYLGLFEADNSLALSQNPIPRPSSIDRPSRNNSARNGSTFLIFDGLDTIATIQLCGENIASTNNQFRRYIFDVSSALQSRPGNGTINITFYPAPSAALAVAESANCSACFGINYEFPYIQYIRKEQCDFGWDFGPAYSPAGIWQAVRAVQLGNGEIYVENSAVDIYRQGQMNNLPPDQSPPWVVNISADYLGELSPGTSLQVKIDDTSGRTVVDTALSNVTINYNGTSGRISGDMLVTEPVDLWWPVGYGEQTLYNVTIQIQDPNNKTIATIGKKTGFRTVVLDQRPISDADIALGIAPGSKWNFEINGHEIFCKGSNMVPPDAFWPRVMQDRIRDMFNSVVDSVSPPPPNASS